jgi:hypothetical protein
MAERLIVVKDAFSARGGVDVLPAVASDRVPPSPFDVVLRSPDGSERRARGVAVVSHVRGPLPPLARIRLEGVVVDDVSPGTEIWIGK